jgi:hypothetical protein
MIPLVLAATWPPFAAASLLYRSDRAAALAGWLVAALCMAMDMYFGWVPAEAVAAVWMVAAAGLLVTCPPRSLRREQRLSRRERRQVRAFRRMLRHQFGECDLEHAAAHDPKPGDRRVA